MGRSDVTLSSVVIPFSFIYFMYAMNRKGKAMQRYNGIFLVVSSPHDIHLAN